MSPTSDPLKEYRESIKALSQLQDPLKEYRESIRALAQLTEPFKEYRESIKALTLMDPLKEYRESIRGLAHLTDQLKEYRESIKSLTLTDPLKEYRESIRGLTRLTDPLKEFRESIKSLTLTDPLKEFRESIRGVTQLTDPLKAYRESIRTLTQLSDPLKGLQESMGTFSRAKEALNDYGHLVKASVEGLGEMVSAISPSQWPEAYDEGTQSIVADAQTNTVTVGSKSISYAEIHALAADIVDRASKQSDARLERAVAEVVQEVRKVKDSTLRKILTWLLFPLIVGLVFSLLNPITDYHIKQILGSDKRQLQKEIKKEVAAAVADPAQLKTYRLVTAEALVVRMKPSSKSGRVGVLHFGHVVVLVQKERDWSLVTWSDGEAQITGWVFSRYLAKLR